MLAKANGYGIAGIDGFPVQVEANVTGGLPAFEVVGLPDAAVKESRERVRAAIGNSGLKMPPSRVAINLAPADVRKAGPSYDLPIALAILAASGQIERAWLEGWLFLGELSFDGRLLPVHGALSIAIAARARGMTRIILPADNGAEVDCIENVDVYPAESLTAVIRHLQGKQTLARKPQTTYRALLASETEEHDLQQVCGQHVARRALEIAAAGGHNLLMIGPPGAGKTMLARCLPGILPDMTFAEALEVTRIHSVAGTLPPGAHLMTRRPFRAPHHSASAVAMVGGGRDAHAGEMTLAHHGVLFLDELPEFATNVLESMRQPLEDGFVSITRINARQVYPAQVMLVAAMNPCRCGYYGDGSGRCHCSPLEVARYTRRISGPLLDRIDMRVEVEAVPPGEVTRHRTGESSATVRERVNAARARQQARFEKTGAYANAALRNEQLTGICALDDASEKLLQQAQKQFHLSMRGYFRVLKVARTIADLAGAADVRMTDVAEALQYRSLDERYFQT